MSSNFFLYPPAEGQVELPESEVKVDQKEDYLPSKELKAAVNVAIALELPLLLTGEPGTGKTRLAFHLAQCFNLAGPWVFNSQTSSNKKDLFYNYNALGHFHWVQNKDNPPITSFQQMEDNHLIRFEALGKAIKLAQEKGVRSVVLIDEIDKAPRDLPNDLLASIEDLQFQVTEGPRAEESNWQCPKNLKPLIVITSNSEKDLPDAFLRRVVYHHIDFPDDPTLLKILRAKQLLEIKDQDLKALIAHFKFIRELNLDKKPATSELIAWANLLIRLSFPFAKLKQLSKLKKDELDLLWLSYSVLAKTKDDLSKLKSL